MKTLEAYSIVKNDILRHLTSENSWLREDYEFMQSQPFDKAVYKMDECLHSILQGRNERVNLYSILIYCLAQSPQALVPTMETLHKTTIKKNADYGDSFYKLHQLMPFAYKVRLFDKVSRIKTLSEKKSASVEDESIIDTMLDLANYCMLEFAARIMDGKED